MLVPITDYLAKASETHGFHPGLEAYLLDAAEQGFPVGEVKQALKEYGVKPAVRKRVLAALGVNQ